VERKNRIVIQEPPISAEAMYRVLRIVSGVEARPRDNQGPGTDDRLVSILQKMI